MKSRPASSASFASARQSSQLADQRSGTVVAERPDEQLAPNSPILSALSLYMAMRDCIDTAGASTVSSSREKAVAGITSCFGRRGDWRGAEARVAQRGACCLWLRPVYAGTNDKCAI